MGRQVTRASVGGVLLVTVLVGGFVIGAINAISSECWPDLGDDDR